MLGDNMTFAQTRSFFFLLAFIVTVLSGCAAKNQSVSDMKVGLHIDAVLELVMEYPLKWTKDRRLEYGRNEGEIRWSHPDQEGTVLLVSSRLREDPSDEQELELVLQDYPGLKATQREQIELPAGQVWHVSGQAAQQHIELYLFLTPHRRYKLVLGTALENAAAYQDLLQEVTFSFQTWSQ